jgi:hypothetical protein
MPGLEKTDHIFVLIVEGEPTGPTKRKITLFPPLLSEIGLKNHWLQTFETGLMENTTITTKAYFCHEYCLWINSDAAICKNARRLGDDGGCIYYWWQPCWWWQ